jgi:uroporphyrin-III C-methyltransferase / precorrin-2 dehydrogenase / sirohydrochlorin ferrochelatase
MFPVMLNIENRPCLVVGGGGVALRKVEGLLADGAVVTVVSPEPIDPLREIARDGRISLETRPYRPGEADTYSLVFAATDDRRVNRGIFEDAERAGVWVNVADDPELCTFHLPARLRRGAFQLAVASAGEAPFVTRRMRKLLEKRFGPEWTEWTTAAAAFRRAVRTHKLTRVRQEKAYDAFFEGTVDPGRLTARVPGDQEMAGWLGDDASPELVRPRAAETAGLAPGLVSLVGAGPGDPGLLTCKGRSRLLAADVIVYDHLATTALPCDLPEKVELRSVGKQAGHHPVPQKEIIALLVRLAQRGKRVVRLKGGDPFIFGRGGEEAEALAAAGVPFEVVPGVTAGIAAAAYAGIPATYRKQVVRATLVTAHESIKAGGAQVRWDLLAADQHATLVGYMGVTSLPQVVDKLLSAGMDPHIPAALVERGTTSAQRVAIGTLAELPRTAERAGIKPPAIFVIGPAVARARALDWFGRLPLQGERLAMIAPGGKMEALLANEGAELVVLPLPLTEAARVIMGALPLTGCIFRSADEVEALADELDGRGFGPDTVAWCLDSAAAERAVRIGFSRVELSRPDAGEQELVSMIMAERAARRKYRKPAMI